MDIIKKIAEELQIRPDQVQAVVNLIDEGNTIPFIARYRKEAHGALNDEILRNLDERLTYLRNLEEKKSSVLASMEELGVLTDDLKKKMEQAQTLAVIEDLYRPYRPKRRTRATIAKEKGLEPLANEILLGQAKGTKEELAKEIQEKEERLKELELEQRTAELELKQLKKKVDNAIVTSTVEGTVKSVTDEETARLENTPIISVVGEDGFYVTGRVAETAFDKIKEGMTVTVTSWTSGMTYEATISGVSSSPSTGYSDGNNENLSYYPFTAVIHGDAELSNGDGVNLSIDDLSSQDEDEIYLEQMFVREDGNQYYVYKKGDNGKLKKQYVEVGKNVSGSLEIVSGLSLDDEIAFPYGRDVREGAKTKSTDTLYDYK